jgi:hypothetical protein
MKNSLLTFLVLRNHADLQYISSYLRNSIYEFNEKLIKNEKSLITILFHHVECFCGLEESFLTHLNGYRK